MLSGSEMRARSASGKTVASAALTLAFSVRQLWRETCYQRSMILIITPSARGQECATTLQEATGDQTHWAESLEQALSRLRAQTYSAVVVDEFLLETGPDEAQHMLEHLGTAPPSI